MVLLSCRYPFYWSAQMKTKNKKTKKDYQNRKLKPKINNDHFLLRFHNTVFDVIFVQVSFSMLGISYYNFENKGKYYLHLQSTVGQWFIVLCEEKLLVRILLLF